MAHRKRVPCRRCSAKIDRDFSVCPACGAEDPLRKWRMRRRAGVTAAVVVTLMVIVSFLAL